MVYYSAEPFREVIEENGCEYHAYPMDWESLDLTDGERILKLYRLVLEYTWKMLPELLEQAKKERPRAVIFDSLALWGRDSRQERSMSRASERGGFCGSSFRVVLELFGACGAEADSK